MHAVQFPSFPCLRISHKETIFSVSNPSLVPPSIRFPSITAPRMGWVWREVKHEDGYAHFWDWEDLGDGKKPCWSGFSEPLKKTIRSEQKTEEVEAGKFIQKRHNIMEIIRKSDGVVLESRTYDTEEEVTKEEAEFGPGPSNYHLEIPDFIPVPPPKRRPSSTTK